MIVCHTTLTGCDDVEAIGDQSSVIAEQVRSSPVLLEDHDDVLDRQIIVLSEGEICSEERVNTRIVLFIIASIL